MEEINYNTVYLYYVDIEKLNQVLDNLDSKVENIYIHLFNPWYDMEFNNLPISLKCLYFIDTCCTYEQLKNTFKIPFDCKIIYCKKKQLKKGNTIIVPYEHYNDIKNILYIRGAFRVEMEMLIHHHLLEHDNLKDFKYNDVVLHKEIIQPRHIRKYKHIVHLTFNNTHIPHLYVYP